MPEAPESIYEQEPTSRGFMNTGKTVREYAKLPHAERMQLLKKHKLQPNRK
ncbi:hypothetical protein [Hymenobacter latericus]|uniref:hypothetical protein n=1 Tax=Hymenobacter sp. YIM 151858-1 TaxID=2987688 RepID=UPI002226E18F|nr:hypothetical protein [Hymenobacter sp. YIM 151858-1]UYZ60147.1 hypothetical protein OIS50_04930 [Hymenobacter sp. YIM 151858-1]